MSKVNISSIKWPQDERVAIKLYLGFLVKVVENEGLKFALDAPNPLDITKKYIAGDITEQKYRATADIWWHYLDNNDATRDFQGQDALKARIAICLLSVTRDDVCELGEHLSWFLEVLGLLGINLKQPIALMLEHFDFQQS